MASPGQRRRLVTIQALTDSKGPSGRPVESWADLTRAWMQREEVSLGPDQSEHFSMNKLVSRSDVLWRMDAQASMDPESVNVTKTRRLVYSGRVYDIVRAVPGKVPRTIELTTMANLAVTA